MDGQYHQSANEDDDFAGAPPPGVIPQGRKMDARVRAFDWAQTPLGPQRNWPSSLATAVGICLASRFPMAICWGPELVLIYNDAYGAILGAKHPQALGRPCYEVWQELRPIIEPMFEGVLRSGEATFSDDLLLPMQRNGYVEEAYFTVSYSPVRDESGGIGGIFVTVSETTGRVVGQRRLRLLGELAQVAGQARDTTQACASIGTLLSDHAADVPFSLVYLFEESGDARLVHGGTQLPDAATPILVPAGDADAVWPIGRAAAAGACEVVSGLATRLPGLRSSAWPEPVNTAVALPLARPGQERPYGVLVAGVSPRRALDDGYLDFLKLTAGQIAVAITNAQAYQEEKRRAEALAEIDRAKTAFFSNVSHEFRTPLTLMIGPTEEALGTPGGALRGADLEMVHRNELRLLKLVNMLLDFSRVESGRAQACYQATDLATLTADVASAFRSAIERGGLRFDVDCPALPEPVYVDRGMWETIVLNLLSNAFKFTFSGAISVGLRWLGSEVELSVRDTGVGIAAQDLSNLFVRFHRVQAARSRSFEGTGIGLALVQELARLHGGRVTVESELDKGTVFRLTVRSGKAHLPADRIGSPSDPPTNEPTRTNAFVEEALRWLHDDGPPEAAVLADADEGATSVVAHVTEGRVLVVDDNGDMRDYLARLLTPRWQVELARDGHEALAAARANPPDLVLTDVMMPGLNGLGLLRELRADPRTADIPVIMLSARAGEVADIQSREAGADDYLTKPFSARELCARVNAQLALRRSRQALERYRAEVYDLFMQAPAPFAVLRGPDLVFEMANPAYLRVLARTNLVGKPLLEAVPEFRGQGFDDMLRRVLTTGIPHVGKETLTLMPRIDGGPQEERYWTFIYSPLRSLSGTIERVMVFAWEVTDQVHARGTLEKARRQAEEASMAKDQFLAMLGHELRNPLSPILTALQLMALRGLRSREQDVIERQVGHLVRLVDDLLDVARIGRGKVELRREPTELARVVVRGIEIAQPMLEQRKQRIEVNVPPDGLLIDGDCDRLAQVVSNLLTNAAKYSEPGSRIWVSARRQGEPGDNKVVLSIRDEGIGIAPHMLNSIFESFVQHRQALDRASGGLGLGLAIVRSLVRMHGGTVSAHSEGTGKGSEFRVELPLLAEDEQVISVIDGTEDSGRIILPPTQDFYGSNRVLVVDDNRDGAEILAETMRELGYLVEIAHDGPSALEIAKRFKPQIALLDIGLPQMDGYELAARLRKMSELNPGIRLVAVTGYGQETDRLRSAKAGFDAHLVKPVNLDTLSTVVRRHDN